MSARVSAEDLSWAAGWMLAYEGENGATAEADDSGTDEYVERCRRVASWLDAEVARRKENTNVRAVARRAGVSTQRARAALRRSAS